MEYEIDVVYDNGFRETVEVSDDRPFVAPFDGTIVEIRLIGVSFSDFMP